jgi:propionate catabolism operon transcriptional regulator
VSVIEEMYDIRIHQYTFLNHSDIERAVRSAATRGIKTIIGGEVGVRIAKKMGLNGIEIGAGEVSVRRAIQEALKVLEERNVEKRKNIRIRSVFDSIRDGVIVSDENRNLTIYNKTAGEMFGKTYEEGEKMPAALFDSHFQNTFDKRESITNVVEKRGGRVIVSDYRPVFLEDDFIGVVSTFSDVTQVQQAEQKIRSELHAKGFVARYSFDNIITQNEEMIALKELAGEYARTDSSVLIEGESGTGKELFAQGIHNASRRASGPFVAVSCAAIAENLLESELFGYESGAFTGAAKKGKEGLFEQAHGGTIFLDEIGEISLQLQTSLLRVLQEKEVRRVGGSKIIPVDVRVIHLIDSKHLNDYIKSKAKGIALIQLNMEDLREVDLIVPPIDQQKAFVELAKQVDKSKVAVLTAA